MILSFEQLAVVLFSSGLLFCGTFGIYHATVAYRFPRFNFIARALGVLLIGWMLHMYVTINWEIFKILFGK